MCKKNNFSQKKLSARKIIFPRKIICKKNNFPQKKLSARKIIFPRKNYLQEK